MAMHDECILGSVHAEARQRMEPTEGERGGANPVDDTHSVIFTAEYSIRNFVVLSQAAIVGGCPPALLAPSALFRWILGKKA